MHDDFQAYYMSTGREEVVLTDYSKDPNEWMVPMKQAEKTSVVEIPGEIQPFHPSLQVFNRLMTTLW